MVTVKTAENVFHPQVAKSLMAAVVNNKEYQET
jgi:hypothetical protein